MRVSLEYPNMKIKILVFINLIILLSFSVNALGITVNSPINGETYINNIPINLTTDVLAKCSYNFWIPSPFGSDNGSLIMWFGTTLKSIDNNFSTQHILNTNFVGYNLIAFECIDEGNNTQWTNRINITINESQNVSSQISNSSVTNSSINLTGNLSWTGYNTYYRYNNISNTCISVELEVSPISQVTVNDYLALNSCNAQILSNSTSSTINNTPGTNTNPSYSSSSSRGSSGSSSSSSKVTFTDLSNKVSTGNQNVQPLQSINLSNNKEDSKVPLLPMILIISIIGIGNVSLLVIRKRK